MRGTGTGGTGEDDKWIRDSLFVIGGIYLPLGGNRYAYVGTRPGPEWWGHGYFAKSLTTLKGGCPKKIVLFKHRWIDRERGVTVHSRPPDDPAYIRFCTLVVVLRVWACVNSVKGFHNREESFGNLWTGCGSDRTVQRWLSRAMHNSMKIQQAIRHCLIEESEPRPVEKLFEGGLSPPDGVLNRRWKSSKKISELYRAYAMLFVAARKLAQHASCLLAGAQRRMPMSEKTVGL